MNNYYATLDEMLKSGRKSEHEETAELIISFKSILSSYSKQAFTLEPHQQQTIDDLDNLLVDASYVIRHHQGENLSKAGLTTSDIRQKIAVYSELAIMVKKPEFDNVEIMVDDLFKLTKKMRGGESLSTDEQETSSYMLTAFDAYSGMKK